MILALLPLVQNSGLISLLRCFTFISVPDLVSWSSSGMLSTQILFLRLWFTRNSILSLIRKYLTKESAAVVVHAFVTSKLDYSNALLYGLPKYQLQRLQYVQNTAARVVLKMNRFQHITPVLCELHWLPIQNYFQDSAFSVKIFHGTPPTYLAQKLHYRSHTRSLRSVSNELLMQHRSYTKTYGDRAFAVHASREWNLTGPMKFGSLTPSRVLKDHLRRTFLLNLVITDHCFCRFVYIAFVLIFFFLMIVNIIELMVVNL